MVPGMNVFDDKLIVSTTEGVVWCRLSIHRTRIFMMEVWSEELLSPVSLDGRPEVAKA